MNLKHFYQKFFRIYFALVLQNIITLSVNLSDNIMLGAYSESALSGVAAVNQIQFILQQLMLALGDGLVILCSQYWGQKRIEPMKKLSAMAMRCALLVAIVLFCLVSCFPRQTLHIFTTDTQIISEGVQYLSIIRFSYLFFAITQILLATLRSAGIVQIALRLSMLTFVVNFGINYTLIFGHFHAPELGTHGAAIGTLTARILELLVLILYILKHEKSLSLRPKDFLKTDAILTKDYIRLTTPIVLIQGLWGVNTALQTVILGHMTAAAIAANSAASNLFLLVKSTAVGAASTASVLIGKVIGEGDMSLVQKYARQLQKTFVVIGILSGIALFFLRIPILSLYKLDAETMRMANSFLIILSVVCMGMSYQMPTNTGIIRGGGSSDFVIKVDFISIWCIVIPLSFFMAFVVKASPIIVVCCLNADQIFKCVPAFLKVNFGHWAKKLTRAN